MQTVSTRGGVASVKGHGRRKVLVALVVGLLAVLYAGGRLDYVLYPVGLNFHTCARNGIGATFCGSDLTAYQARWRGVEQQVQAAQAKIRQIQQSNPYTP